jgi:hypothetical protein
MVVNGADAAANTQQLVVAVPISNPPVVTFTPVDGVLVNGTLQVSGTAITDKSGIVTVTVSLGDVQFLKSTDTNFSGSYDIAGMAAGAYGLTVRATDNTNGTTEIRRTVLVTSSSSLVYTPLFSLPASGQLLAVEGSKLLYLAGDGTAWLRDMATAAEVRLSAPFRLYPYWGWQISGGRVYLSYTGSDCLRTCVYQFEADGSMLNLSNANPYSVNASHPTGRTEDRNPVAHPGYVIWTNDVGYTLYEVARGTYSKIAVPQTYNDFYVAGDVVHVFYGIGGESGTVFRWSSDTNASVKVGSLSQQIWTLQTDGVRVGWAGQDCCLWAQPVAGGQTTTMYSDQKLMQMWLRDGVLAWEEYNASASNRVVKADTLGGTVTLSALSTARLIGNGGGYVVYGQHSKLYSWGAATGQSTLRVDVTPDSVLVGGGAMVFNIGTAVYRVGLN